MTLLDVIDLDEMLTVNFMWQNKFFGPLPKVGAALVWDLWENQNKKIKKINQKTKINEYDGFRTIIAIMFSNIITIIDIIIIILIFLLPTYFSLGGKATEATTWLDLFISHVRYLFLHSSNLTLLKRWHQISLLYIPHTTCIDARHARPVTVFAQNLVRERWFIQSSIHFPPPTIFWHSQPLLNKFAYKYFLSHLPISCFLSLHFSP